MNKLDNKLENKLGNNKTYKNALIPMKIIGPIDISFDNKLESISVPLATFESPLWPSVARGARLSRHVAGGIKVYVKSSCMSRSVAFSAQNSGIIHEVVKKLPDVFSQMQQVVSKTSSFAKLLEYHPEIIANQLFIRFKFHTGDASGHNMVTKAAEKLMDFLLEYFAGLALKLEYVSISGNICTDKKVSAINSLLDRGVHVCAEIIIPKKLCEKFLKTDAEKIVDLHIRKNLLGSIVAGSVRSANAHVANILLAFYLATGQDAANIVEGSQAIDHAQIQGDNLYFSVTLPNVIVGTVGSGKNLDFVVDNLNKMGCLDKNKNSGDNKIRLASICAAAVLCSELSLLAAQTNPGELMQAHLRLERMQQV